MTHLKSRKYILPIHQLCINPLHKQTCPIEISYINTLHDSYEEIPPLMSMFSHPSNNYQKITLISNNEPHISESLCGSHWFQPCSSTIDIHASSFNQLTARFHPIFHSPLKPSVPRKRSPMSYPVRPRAMKVSDGNITKFAPYRKECGNMVANDDHNHMIIWQYFW